MSLLFPSKYLQHGTAATASFLAGTVTPSCSRSPRVRESMSLLPPQASSLSSASLWGRAGVWYSKSVVPSASCSVIRRMWPWTPLAPHPPQSWAGSTSCPSSPHSLTSPRGCGSCVTDLTGSAHPVGTSGHSWQHGVCTAHSSGSGSQAWKEIK